MRAFHLLTSLAVAGSAVFAPLAHAADTPELAIAIKNHKFDPAEVKVPAGKRVKLVVHNQDSTAEEFESHSMNREKVIPAGARASIFVGPLKPGRYTFFGEFHEKTAQGVVIAE